ncbi:hypothetical protein [Moorena bouillonii]|uniref:hypothetical protein n=1 Tax=Moorena bouillonii TaxID=207920 RepID=UPI0013013DD8|nr:hypothetical protein [Moorena bouillonii]
MRVWQLDQLSYPFAHPTRAYAVLPVPCSRLPTPDSRLPTPDSLFPITLLAHQSS